MTEATSAKPWLATYGDGIPAEIDANAYRSVVDMSGYKIPKSVRFVRGASEIDGRTDPAPRVARPGLRCVPNSLYRLPGRSAIPCGMARPRWPE